MRGVQRGLFCWQLPFFYYCSLLQEDFKEKNMQSSELFIISIMFNSFPFEFWVHFVAIMLISEMLNGDFWHVVSFSLNVLITFITIVPTVLNWDCILLSDLDTFSSWRSPFMQQETSIQSCKFKQYCHHK